MKKGLNILVTGCGGDIGQSIGKILLAYEHTKNLYGIDISDKNAAQFIFPNFSVGLRFTHKDYLKRLTAFIEDHDIDLVIPIAEPELRFFSDSNILDTIGRAKMITASSIALEVGFDKFKTAAFLEDNKFPFPKTILANEIEVLEDFPVILKSRTGSGSKDIYKINNNEEFLFYTRNTIDDYVVQELISDEDGEFTCGLFRSRRGDLRSIILKRELEGGYSGYGEVVENTAITALLERLAVVIDLVGSINVQLRLEKGVPMVFEINPRFSSTIYFRHLFGFQDLIWAIEDVQGNDLADYQDVEVGRKFYKGFEEYIK